MNKRDNQISRVFKILNLLAGSGEGMGFNEIQKRSGDIPSPTLSRILKILVSDEMVLRTEKRMYTIGPAFRELAMKTFPKRSKKEIVQPILYDLAERTGESAAFFCFVNNTFQVLAKAEYEESFHYMKTNAPHTDPFGQFFGRVAMAYVDESLKDEFKGNYQAPPEGWERYEQKCSALRDQGYAQSIDRKKPSVSRVAMPVFDPERELAGVLGITILRADITDEEYARYRAEVQKAVKEVERALK